MKALLRTVDELDDALRQRVVSYLDARDPRAFRGLRIDVQHGAVTLSGKLRTFYERQVAVASCHNVVGLLAIIDRLTVEDWETQPAEHPFWIE